MPGSFSVYTFRGTGLIGDLYGVSSERRLVEELRMHLAWRWFTGLGFDQEIPHPSTFSKNRHGRLQESNLFQELFEQIVGQCIRVGLVKGEHLSVDGSLVQANANSDSRIPREQLAEVAQVKRTVRQYLTELEEENGDGEPPPVQEQEKVSTTDPDATYASKGKGLATLGYYDNYLIDNPSCVMVGVQATAARFSQESVAAREMITRFHQRQRRYPQSLAADTSYGNGELLHWLQQREITPYMRVKQNAQRKNDRYGIEKFTYDEEANRHLCPAGKTLTYVGVNALNRTHVYAATLKRCRDCPPKTQCTKGRCRFLGVHIHEAARQRAQELARTPAFVAAQRARRKVEALVCRTQEPDRIASFAPASNEIRPGTVLLGRHGPESQTVGAVAEPETHRSRSRYGVKQERGATDPERRRDEPRSNALPKTDFFNSYTCYRQLCPIILQQRTVVILRLFRCVLQYGEQSSAAIR
jgi:hypothetical protein